MIQKELQSLKAQIEHLRQQVALPPKLVRIKEYFPAENSVTIQFIENGRPGDVPQGKNKDFKFPLGYRGDVSEGLSIQPGDTGFLMYSGWQYKGGFVLLAYTEGGDEAMSYVPVRGGWAI